MARDAEMFAGGTAVITGAGSGIGAGIARRCGALGMTVVVADIDPAAGQATVDQIVAAGGKAEFERVDVSRPEELDRLAEAVFARHGAVRLLVNNAGIETVGFTWEVPTARWEATLNINVHGVIHSARAFVPRMIASGQECWIANLSSVGGFGAMPAQTAYTVSKHAVEAFSECLHLEMEVKQLPIHVSSVIPGPIRTNIFNAEGGAGEPEGAQSHRHKMFEMLRDYGMDGDEAGRVIVEGIAANRFWVHTHPEMSMDIIEQRIAFFRSQQAPVLNDQVRHLVED